MATDFDGAAAVRSLADGLDERVLVKLQDGDNPGGANETMTISEKKAHVRVHAKDSDGTDQEMLLSQEGHVQSNGDYDAATNKRPSSQGMIASDRDAAPSETTMNKRPTAVAGDDNKIALDVAMSDSQGNAITEANPLPTYAVESPGDEVDDYNDADAVAVDATANHDYTVTALKTLKAIEAHASSSGDARFELQVETGVATGIFDTVMVKFTSKQKQDVSFTYKKKVAAGVIVRLAKRNDDNKPQSLYSQIQGIEI